MSIFSIYFEVRTTVVTMGCGRREQGEQLLPQSLRKKFTMGLLPKSFGKILWRKEECYDILHKFLLNFIKLLYGFKIFLITSKFLLLFQNILNFFIIFFQIRILFLILYYFKIFNFLTKYLKINKTLSKILNFIKYYNKFSKYSQIFKTKFFKLFV